MDRVLHSWLPLQCRILGGTVTAAVLIGPPDEGPFKAVMHWPPEQTDTAVLSRVIRAALRSRQTILKTRHVEAEGTGEPRDALACPLIFADRLHGVVAFDMPHRSQAFQRMAVQQVRAGVIWLETMLGLVNAAATDQRSHLIDLVAAGLDHEGFKLAATEVATELAQRFSCERVSLGFFRYGRVHLEAMSHTSRIETSTRLTGMLRNAMIEAIDQQATILYPPPDHAPLLVTRCHEIMAKENAGGQLCTIPLVKGGTVVGALLLESSADHFFTDETVRQCEQIALLLGPVLQTRRSDESPLVVKLFTSLRQFLAKLLGPRHLILKLTASALAVAILLLALTQADFRISSDAYLEAGRSRAVVAPQNGFIASSDVRAGDLVRQGQLLATLDDRDLRQQERKWRSQRGQILKEYRRALAEGERAEVAILTAKRAQAEAQLELVARQLERIQLVAPFAGLVVNGDLSQALGSPVERGETLFEVAPMDDYRLVMKVDDRDIGYVQTGQRGRLKLTGMPDRLIDITIDRLTPVATSESGRNYFRVEARLETRTDLMRPGMAGVSKIEVGRENLLWIASRRLLDWLRLAAWTRLP